MLHVQFVFLLIRSIDLDAIFIALRSERGLRRAGRREP